MENTLIIILSILVAIVSIGAIARYAYRAGYMNYLSKVISDEIAKINKTKSK